MHFGVFYVIIKNGFKHTTLTKGVLMSDLIFTLNAVLPIILLVALGYFLKRIGFITSGGAREMNKLAFRVFIPAMLFLNVYSIENMGEIKLGYIFYVCAAVIFVFFAALLGFSFITKDKKRRGALLQSAFRSNYALVGIPLAISLFGDEGGIYATLLSAFCIPLFNVLAVIALSIFSGENAEKVSFKKIILGIVKNPLIVSIAAGGAVLVLRAIFVKTGIEFRLSDVTPIYKILGQLSAVATPLSLIVLGANFEFSAVSGMKKEIISGTVARCVITPVIGIGAALLLGCFENAHFAALVAVFGTPVAVSSVPMAQEMDSDYELAGQLVIWTTLVSAFTLFIYIYVLRIIGIF